MTTIRFKLTLLLAVLVLGTGCHSASRAKQDLATSGPTEWQSWKAKRHESIAGTNGWLTLVGRHWLEEGENSFGRNASNRVVIRSDRAPESIGVLMRQNKSVRLVLAEGVKGWVAGQPVTGSIELLSDRHPVPTLLIVNDLKFVIIDRGDRVGLRVRDPRSSARDHFPGLTYFPYAPEWRVSGTFERYAQPRSVLVDTIIGNTESFVAPGVIHFRHRGEEHSLEVVEEEGVEDYFVLFKDQTNGRRTYPAGRFLYVPRPDPNGQITIDFNRAYTPPCGFTPYATCPLPPRRNWLPFPIQAGEKAPSASH